MLITINPIGSVASDVSAAAAAYVAYLCGGAGGAATTAEVAHGSPEGAMGDELVGYYAADGHDIVDGAGWWSGGGAGLLDLAGSEVEIDSFRTLLQGRHHLTADRLVSAQGSSGRVHLKAGHPTRMIGGIPMWSERDAAARIKGHIPEGLFDDDDLVTFRGETFYDMKQVRRLLEHTDQLRPQITLEDITNGPERVKLSALAEAMDLSPRYLRTICKEISDGTREDGTGLAPSKEGKTWTVDRDGALQWEREREPVNVRVGYDATLTTEKSVSVLALCGPEAHHATVKAIKDANSVALEWLDRNASTGRERGESIESHGHAVASFMHGTSRNDDPFLHVHNVVLNAIVDENNTGRALDASGLYAQAPAAAALATASMRRQLSTELGVNWKRSGRDVWEIAGIEDDVLTGFASRSAEIKAALAELETELDDATPSLRHEVAASTRQTKSDKKAAELRGGWLQRADEIGFDAKARAKVTGRSPTMKTELSSRDRKKLWSWLSAPEGAMANQTTARMGDVLWAITNWAPNGTLALLSPEQILSEASTWLGSDQVLLVDESTKTRRDGVAIGKAVEQVWTTTAIVELQQTIAAAWADGHGVRASVVPGHMVGAAIQDADVTLSEEQQDLVWSWLGSGHKIQAALGRPGTGKTTTMAVAAAAWETAGYQVLGAAIKGEAARLLGEEAGIRSNTVASYLTAWERFDTSQLNDQSVLIVDEASTLSDWDLGRLIALTSQTGATLRLIGDPAQHSSVEAGGSWSKLMEQFAADTPELKSQRRLTNPIEVEATELIRSQEFAAALSTLDKAGSLRGFDSWEQAAVPLIKRWWAMRQQGNDHPMIERTNDRREVLNALAQAVRVKAGEVKEPVAVGTKSFGVGDQVLAKQPDRALQPKDADHHDFVRNGSTGTITKIGPKNIVVDFDSLGLVKVPRKWAAQPKGLDLAYAMTSYAIQGATNNVSTSVIAEGVGAAELLVNLTRGRHQNMVFAVGEGHDEFARQQPEDIATAIAESVRISKSTPIADRDRTAAARANEPVVSLAKLDQRTQDATTQAARKQRAVALDLAARFGELPGHVANGLGPRPTARPLQARWERIAHAVLAYWDQHRPRPTPSTPANPIDQALGKPRTEAGWQDRSRLKLDIDLLHKAIAYDQGILREPELAGAEL